MELWDLYTREGTPTGEMHVRGEEMPDDRYHLVVDIWLKRADGRYLISRRAAHRASNAGMLEVAGGSVTAGEDSLTGALRETKEEVGVDLDPASGKKLLTFTFGIVNGEKQNWILDVWLFPCEGEVDLSRATTDETSAVYWMTPDEIRAHYDAGEFVDTVIYFFEHADLFANS